MNWLVYVHPVGGGAVIALLAYVAILGLRVRRSKVSAKLAKRHARFATIAYASTAAVWAVGIMSTFWLREDLDVFTSLHFRTGSVMVFLLTGSAITAHRLRAGDGAMRDLHPWFGIGATMLAAAQVATGLQLTP